MKNGWDNLQILTFTDFLFPNYLGGSARFASDLNDALVLNGHSVSEVSRPASGAYSGSPSKRTMQALKQKFSVFWRYDYVFSHHPVFAIVPALLFSYKFVYFYHGPFAEEYLLKKSKRTAGYYARKWLERFILARCKTIIVVSKYMADKIEIFQDKTVNLGPIQKVSTGKGDLTFKYQRGPKYKCLTVRRLTARTGVLEFLDVVANNENLKVTVVGSGELKDSLASKYESIVEFHHDISDSDLRQKYMESDIFVLPSLDLEGFGLVVLEALSAGVPVLASTTSGGAYEFLKQIGITTFMDIYNDDNETIERKIGLVIAEFKDEMIIEEIKSMLQKSFYTAYADRILNVLRS